MYKRAIWINPLTTVSTSLDITINPHDVDTLALTDLLEKKGYEVWLQESFTLKSKQSKWKNKIYTKDIVQFSSDIAIMNCGYFFFDYINHRYLYELNEASTRALNFRLTMNWLKNFKGQVYIFTVDPREKFLEIFKLKLEDLKFKHKELYDMEEVHTLLNILQNAKILAATSKLFDESLHNRVIEVEYWKNLDLNPLPYKDTYTYDCVYTGVKSQTKQRKQLIKTWFNTDKCFTAGDIEISGIKSLTDHKKCLLSKTLDYVQHSKTSLVCGEPRHYWLTPRVIQSLCQGTIASIHPDFNGKSHFTDRMNDVQTFSSMKEFDDSLLSKETYQHQLDFVKDLKNNIRPLNEF